MWAFSRRKQFRCKKGFNQKESEPTPSCKIKKTSVTGKVWLRRETCCISKGTHKERNPSDEVPTGSYQEQVALLGPLVKGKQNGSSRTC